MLNLCEVREGMNYRKLKHGPEIFHEALAYVSEGERCFDVTDGEGNPLYGLVYEENQLWAEASEEYVHSKQYDNMLLYPSYLTYDEERTASLCLDPVKSYDSVWFEQVSEYSVVLARVLLAITDKTVFFADERIQWFISKEEAPRLMYADQAPADALPVFGHFVPSTFDGDFMRMDAMVLFHHVFLFQWLTPLDPADVKYVELVMPKTEGIEGLLLAYGRARAFFGALGMQVTIKPGCTCFSDGMLKKYLRLPFTPEDAGDGNTIRLIDHYSVMNTKMLRQKVDLDISIVQPTFLGEMKMYGDAVIRDQRMLGVLLRGIDYVSPDEGEGNCHRAFSEVAPVVAKWYEMGSYDKIFLATEDGDIFDDMISAFGRNLVSVPQERYRASDFQDGITTISELERLRHPDGEYDAYVEDTVVNYLYSIYMLSRCEAFMYSCHCGGVSLARQFNGDRYEKMFSFADD